MSTLSDIQDRLETGISLRYIAESYTETSAKKLKEIRRDVERNRAFFSELASLYHAIKVVAAEKYHIFSQKNNKTAIVLITSNYRFFGNLNAKLADFFAKETSSRPGDYFIVGKAGAELLQGMSLRGQGMSSRGAGGDVGISGISFETVSFHKDLPTNTELKSFVARLSPYKQVLVFYPEFKSILVQNPVVKDITEAQDIKEPNAPEHKNVIDALLGKHPDWSDDYIFEPRIENILEFFDAQMITILVEEAFLESELAKTAARLVTMDEAQIKAEEFVRVENREFARAIVRMKNAHLLESFISKQQKYVKGNLSM
ncbi:MAG: F0F1 ATP synthase subunit gamma [bacterium]|nr:F0F1 ATP synthase subunit gamma [bacterium]